MLPCTPTEINLHLDFWGPLKYFCNGKQSFYGFAFGVKNMKYSYYFLMITYLNLPQKQLQFETRQQNMEKRTLCLIEYTKFHKFC